MKKILFIGLCLLGTALNASAQFKIHSNGNMSFKRTSTTLPKSPVSLGNGGTLSNDSNYFVSYRDNKCGFYVFASDSPGINGTSYGANFRCTGTSTTKNVGLIGYASNNNEEASLNTLASVGLWGDFLSTATGRYSYGVLGTAYSVYDNCASICGIAPNTYASYAIPDDQYAGLFVGRTKVAGNLDVTGTVNGVIISPSERGATDVRSVGGETLTEKIQGLSTLSFRYPERVRDDSQRPTFLEPDEDKIEEMKRQGIDPSKAVEVKPDILAEQVQAKQHYAIPADELEKVFPDLVYTDKDGTKSVNYVEMVPLLVQCINELNARLSALDDDSAARRESRLSNSADSRISPVNAVLYQNTPNPFTAQTEIRFSLPDDAPASYIYIFDMTGKMQKQIPVDPNQQSVTINGYELSAGIYLYSLVVGGQEIDTKRMIITK